jgi:hypothetical protein
MLDGHRTSNSIEVILVMADESSQFAGESQEAGRPLYEAMQGLAETQFKILQQLANIQRDQFNQALEAARDQLQLISQMRDPRGFAAAQADLLKGYSEKYLDSVNEAVDIVTQAWEEYGKQVEKSMKTATDAVQRAAQTATRGSQEAMSSATESTKKASPKKSP